MHHKDENQRQRQLKQNAVHTDESCLDSDECDIDAILVKSVKGKKLTHEIVVEFYGKSSEKTCKLQ